MKKQRETTSSFHSTERGSALVSAMMFAFIVSLLAGSYLFLSSGEYRVAARSHLMGASFNLAEGGIDHAINILNRGNDGSWATGLTPDGTRYWSRTFSDYSLGGGFTGEIRVAILDPESQNSEIISEGRALGHPAGPVEKQVMVQVSSGFFPFKSGFNSKEGIVLSGNNVTFDSYDSRDGPYGPGNKNSEVSVSTISIESDAVDVGNGDIFGFVATGGGDPDVGPNGSITTYANPGVVDESRITKDFYAEFPNVSEPSLTAPVSGFPTSGIVLGGEYVVDGDWTMSGNKLLEIAGDVTLIMRGDMKVSGKAKIVIEETGSFNVYASEDVAIGGNGILNDSQLPEQFMLFGTETQPGDQDISISGNGYLAGTVYAPNAIVSMNGGGSSGRIFGAVAGYDASVVGDSHFSYDEALADFNLGEAGHTVDAWAELTNSSSGTSRKELSQYGL